MKKPKITSLPGFGGQEYTLDGKLHRSDGPAMTYTLNKQIESVWASHDQVHRYYGPARTRAPSEWFLHGKQIK